MLSFEEKVKYFESVMEEELSYADSFNSDIQMNHENSDYEQLSELETKIAIDNYLIELKSYLVMHGSTGDVDDIIDCFLLPAN